MFLQEPYLIFTISALILMAIAILEAIAVMTVGSSMDSLIPHADGEGLDIGLHDNLSMDVFNSTKLNIGFEGGINLLNLGKVPFMIVLAALTAWFTISGYSIHFVSSSLGFSLSNYFVAPFSFGIATLGTYFTTKMVSRFLPSEKSYSISEKDLIGSIGVVTVGEGDSNKSVQVRIVDKFGSQHYIQAKVALPNITVKAKEKVIVLKKGKDTFYKILPKVSLSEDIKVENKQSIDEFLINSSFKTKNS